MNIALTKIKGLIQTFLLYGPDSPEGSKLEEFIDHVMDTVESLRFKITEELDKKISENENAKQLAQLQTELTLMADEITLAAGDGIYPKSKLQILDTIIGELFILLEFLQTQYPSGFNFEAILPLKFRARFIQSHQAFFDQFAESLNGKGIEPDLLAIINQLGFTCDQDSKFKTKTWAQWNYLIGLINSIASLLEKPDSADINLDFLKLFVSREFNSIRVYACFLRYLERITLNDSTFQEQHQELLYMIKVFKQVRVEVPSCYDNSVQSLKLSVIECLEAELIFLEQKEKLYLQNFKATNPDSPSKFYFQVSITLAELMFFFRVALEVGLIQTKFNSYLYEFIANHIRTQRAENISKKSMRNHFSNKPFPDRLVRNIRDLLHKMISHIDLYYKY